MFKYLKKRFEGITTEKFNCSILNDSKKYYVRSAYMFKSVVYSILSRINKNDNLHVDIKVKQSYSWTMSSFTWTMSSFTVKVSIVGGTFSERQQLMVLISHRLFALIDLFIDGDLTSLKEELGIQ